MSQDFGTLGRLVVSLEANLVQFEAGLNKAEYQMQQFGERMDTLASKAGSALKGLAATAAAAFTFDAIVSGVEKAITAAAELEKMSQKAGVSVEALSGLKSAAKLSGTALEDVVGSLQKLDKAMIEAESGSQKQAATKVLRRVQACSGVHACPMLVPIIAFRIQPHLFFLACSQRFRLKSVDAINP